MCKESYPAIVVIAHLRMWFFSVIEYAFVDEPERVWIAEYLISTADMLSLLSESRRHTCDICNFNYCMASLTSPVASISRLWSQHCIGSLALCLRGASRPVIAQLARGKRPTNVKTLGDS